jgi:5-methylcytosine-specific restriction protein A
MPGCRGRATHRGYCETHAKAARQARPSAQPGPRQRGYTSEWDRISKAYRAEHPDCERCGAPGELVDHITPKSAGGTDDDDNLMTLCRPCHGVKSVSDGSYARSARREAFGPSRIPVTIVAGPPGSGKTSYVTARKAWGDLVVDMDLLYVALTGGGPMYDKPDVLLPFVATARDAVMSRLARGSDVRRAWLITGKGNAAELLTLKAQLAAERIVVLEVAPAECLRRIREDPRRAERWQLWEPLIRKWWTTYQSSKALLERDEMPVFA